MVEASEVRKYLNNISIESITDDVIEIQLELANTKVEENKSESALEQTVEDAILTWAGYLSYLAYATNIERGVGAIPGPMLIHLDMLKAIADEYLGYAMRGETGMAVGPQLYITETVSKRWNRFRYGY